MVRYIARRLSQALLTLLVISFVIHAALDIAPGDAADALAGDTAGAEQMEALREALNLNAPSISRYFDYVSGILLRGDWGRSMVSDRPVGRLLATRLVNTLVLAAVPVAVATIVGGAAGLVAARHSGRLIDGLVITGTALGMASPTYWTALLLFWIFALRLNWLPVLAGKGVEHLILPTITLGMPLSASVARFVRVNVLGEMHKAYIGTARAKGASERRVLLRHALRNGLGPVVHHIGTHLGHLLGGTFVVETIYAWPGLGALMVQAIFDRDHPVVMGAGLLIAGSYIIINLLADLIHVRLDPRVAAQAL